MRFVPRGRTATWGRPTTLRTRRSTRGFTLIEVLLVLAVIGIMCVVTLPHFFSAMREHRLRGAARKVISVGRHAASLAVISQRELDMTFDLDRGIITVGVVRQPVRTDDGLLEGEDAAGREGADGKWARDVAAVGNAESFPEENAPRPLPPLLEEDLEVSLDGIRIETLEIEGEDEKLGGQSRRVVRYFTNGRCTPYKVSLVDEDGYRSVIEVDALCAPEVIE